METDFLHVKDVTYNKDHNTGWMPHNYNQPAGQARAPYGMAKQSRNLVPNYIDSPHNWLGPGVEGIDPGLQLWVRSTALNDKLVPSAEIVTEREDILYGSFRIGMKTTDINGTCSAFFFYRNDTQEIDLEILSAEQHNDLNQWPIHLDVQNSTTGRDPKDYDGGSELIYDMAFPPGGTPGDYNEYRFDWLPGRIDYYVNSRYVWTTTENVPSEPGRIHMSHWSNGNPSWTHGPPIIDAVTTVSYVKAYFNSTDRGRQFLYHRRCPTDRADYVLHNSCEIPNQERVPNPFGADGNTTGHTFFFSHHHNMIQGQTIYDTPLTGAAAGTEAFVGVGVMLLTLVAFWFYETD
ncbi:hypothetical protein LTR37_016824 [Vermiconidia calcicola]|uniref:Uncharacterized protein n=1 Tax=Vermiconidia calcicola TaxID=1690605 RepID=A0ACC3MMM4_9PEZI|nr:hypothetical protein LTR37_016824 [Vermiconidia calcicola]